ncbi:hypothetical protein B1808_06280 [Pseudofulvimonas gallinarii]|nr:hypothetical protein B1808_06280 [Pseudofulvimonas gallinarii]
MFALLLQGVVAVACQLHDAGHVVEAALHGHAVDDADSHPEQDTDSWHVLFHAGHHCQHVPATGPAVALHLPPAPAAALIPASALGPPEAPSSLLFRPPISV